MRCIRNFERGAEQEILFRSVAEAAFLDGSRHGRLALREHSTKSLTILSKLVMPFPVTASSSFGLHTYILWIGHSSSASVLAQRRPKAEAEP